MEENVRIQRGQLSMRIAELYAKRSKCGRLQVGAVVTSEGRIVASGYNSPLKCIGDRCACDLNEHCMKAIHAEANLIAFSAKNGITLKDSILYVTHSPCLKCAELIIQSGIIEVNFKEKFRSEEGLDLLKSNGILVHQQDAQ